MTIVNPSLKSAPDGQEPVLTQAANVVGRIAAEIPQGRRDGIACGNQGGFRVAMGAAGGLGHDGVDDAEPQRSWAVIFMLVAASWARPRSRHRIEAEASGEATV